MADDQTILIHGGTVCDGTGRAPFAADVMVQGDKVAVVGRLGLVEADQTLDASGRIVCPGFIDPHNHADGEVQGGIVAHPLADNLLRQGITTVVGNQCGGSTYPIAPFLDAVDAAHPVTNVAMLASHGHARRKAMKDTGNAQSCPEVWQAMHDLIYAEMEAGAFGVTACPLGSTQEALPTEELIEAARAVAPFEGVYASHIRDEGETGRHLEAIDEVRTIARESGARGHVSHLKLWGMPNWGQTEQVLAIFDAAQAEGTSLMADQYPYIGGYRGFFSLLWSYQRSDGRDEAWRQGALAEVKRQVALLGGAERFILSSHDADPDLDGKTLAEVADAMSLAPEAAVVDLYLREPRPRLACFFLAMREEDVRVFMAADCTMAGTDSHVRVPGSGASHPRNFGTYPRLLGKYVREEGLMPIERMVHRATAKVADQFRIPDRGRLIPGACADVVVFDPATVRDRSTWQQGYLYPEGIEWVLVNGGIEVAGGEPTGEGFGRAIRRR